METNQPKKPVHWLKACGPVHYLACGESIKPTDAPTYQRDKVTCQDCLSAIWQIAYTAAGLTVEHLCELSDDPHGKYAAAVRSGHYEAVSLERWNGEIFTSVHAWRA